MMLTTKLVSEIKKHSKIHGQLPKKLILNDLTYIKLAKLYTDSKDMSDEEIIAKMEFKKFYDIPITIRYGINVNDFDFE